MSVATEGPGTLIRRGNRTRRSVSAGLEERLAQRSLLGGLRARGFSRRSTLTVAGVLAVASLPILQPGGPNNTALPDLALVGFLFLTIVWAATRNLPVRMPYVLPIGLSIAAAALAGIAVKDGLLVIVADLSVFFWAIAIVNHARTLQLFQTMIRAWAVTAIVYAFVMVVGVAVGIDALAGYSATEGARASGPTFGDSNYASHYLLVSLFLIRAAQVPKNNRFNLACCGLLAIAIFLTGSNGAMLGLIMGTGLSVLFSSVRRGKTPTGVAVVSLAAIVTVLFTGVVDYKAAVAEVAKVHPILNDSIGRTLASGPVGSTDSRARILEQSMYNWFNHDTLLGHGAARTEAFLREQKAAYVTEAHNDYIAALIERGVLGAIAVVLLCVMLIVRARRVGRAELLKPGWSKAFPRPEMLGAAVAAILLSGLFYEVLHYRHVWAFFGILAALDVWGRRTEAVL